MVRLYFTALVCALLALGGCASGDIDGEPTNPGRTNPDVSGPGDGNDAGATLDSESSADSVEASDTADDAAQPDSSDVDAPEDDASAQDADPVDSSDADASDSSTPDPDTADAEAPCIGGCATGLVCRNQQCVSICEAAQVECGATVVDGINAQCGGCATGEVCSAGQCIGNLCATNQAQCGEVSWNGATEQCGMCPNSSDDCVQNRCAGSGYREISGGEKHTCALRSNGQVWCWGARDTGSQPTRGELGDASTDSSLVPVTVTSLSGATSIATHYQHSCAHRQNGTAWCWGLNADGQLGDNFAINRTTPVQATGYSNVIDIGTGKFHSCLAQSDGRVWCWGDGERGQLGHGDSGAGASSFLPVLASISSGRTTKLALGSLFSCALQDNHSVWCWGAQPGNPAGESVPRAVKNGPRSSLRDVVDIAAGDAHACAVLRSGQVWCWGNGSRGQLGNGSTGGTDLSGEAIEVRNIPSVRQIAAGGAHTCAVTLDDKVYCWGANQHGQVGNGATTDQRLPTLVPSLSSVLQVGLGESHSCAVKLDGSAWCWGDNAGGQLGDGTTTARRTPVRVQ